MTLPDVPCNIKLCPVAPTVRAPVGLMLLVPTPAKVGVALELIFWMVLAAPLLTEKLVLLKLAMPLVVVVASLTVMVEPAAVASATVSAPDKPFRLLTPPPPPPPVQPAMEQMTVPPI